MNKEDRKDLVERLRNTPTERTWDSVGRPYDYPKHLPLEAADEIDRLRRELEEARRAWTNAEQLGFLRQFDNPMAMWGKQRAEFGATIPLYSTPPAAAVTDRLPAGHVVLEQADMLDGRVSQTVRRPNGTEYERIVDGDEAYGSEE